MSTDYRRAVSDWIREAARRNELNELAGTDEGPGPYDELERVLRDALESLEAMRRHTHRWGADDYCTICGADGRA